MNAFSATLTRLQPGQVLEFAGERYLCVFVNDCRARLVPQQKHVVVVTTAAGKSATFQRYGASVNVSPNSELPIVGVDHDWLAKQTILSTVL